MKQFFAAIVNPLKLYSISNNIEMAIKRKRETIKVEKRMENGLVGMNTPVKFGLWRTGKMANNMV